jgi:hypothetical protein
VTEFLRVNDVARRFAVRPRTVRDWIRQGLLKARRDPVTRRVYVTVESVHERQQALDAAEWTPQPERRPQRRAPPSPVPDPPPAVGEPPARPVAPSSGEPAVAAGGGHIPQVRTLPKKPEKVEKKPPKTEAPAKEEAPAKKPPVDEIERDLWGEDDEADEDDDL